MGRQKTECLLLMSQQRGMVLILAKRNEEHGTGSRCEKAEEPRSAGCQPWEPEVHPGSTPGLHWGGEENAQ